MTGKYKHAYNVRKLADNVEENGSWVDLKDYDVVEETEEEFGMDVEGEEEKDEGAIHMESDEIYGRREQSNINKIIDLAKEKELDSGKENEVYEEVKEEEGMQLVRPKWIIKEKEKQGGKIWKDRLVTRSFTKKFDAKYECEASTCSAESLKLVLAVIKTFRWRVRMLDVKTSCLQGKEMTREVYLKPPMEA